MSTILIEIILIIALVILNGYFSLSEIALLSVKKSRLRHLSKQGNKKAQDALFLTRKSPEMLSTIQIGITMIGIFAGAFGGATVAEHMEQWLAKFSMISAYSEPISVAIVVVTITFLSLVVGELVPKQIALSNPEKLSLRVAGPVKMIMKITTPAVKLLSASTSFFLKLLHIKPASEQIVTEEEIKLLIAEGAESGVFERAEQKMVESIFHLGNRPIKDFMTPGKEVVWLDINDTLSVIKEKITGSDRSVFPVCDGHIDRNIGAIETKDVLTHLFDSGLVHMNLKSLVQPVMRIDADVPSLVAIERLKRSSISIVLITEKTSSKVVGIISFHDMLEAIVGEFKGGL
ncbi:MAG: HlyC/CorC family transporter [Candidatus Magasanikbacteria bacterium]|nr:HlyC/CorC family transporter [Candidatus Magasanikbacteria bacterium]